MYIATGYSSDLIKRLAPSAGRRWHGAFGRHSTFNSGPKMTLLRLKAREATGAKGADGDRMWPRSAPFPKVIEQSTAGEKAEELEAHDAEESVAEDTGSKKENRPWPLPSQAQLAHAVEVSMVVVAVYEKLDEVRWRETNARIWCRRVVMYKEELAQIIADAYEVKASNPLGLAGYSEDREAQRAWTEKRLEETQVLATDFKARAEEAKDKLVKLKSTPEWHEWEHANAPPSS